MKITKDFYIIDNIQYNRVTSILDYFTPPNLIKWRDKVGIETAKKTMSTAKKIGTRGHSLIKTHFTTRKWKLTSNDSIGIHNGIEAYKKWYEVEKPEIKGMEITVSSRELGLAGTLDIELINDTIIDTKFSSSIRPNYWLQVAMYSFLRYKIRDIPRKIAILRLDKFTADYEYRVIDFDEGLVDIYLGLLTYYRYITRKEEKDGNHEVTNREIYGGLEIN